VLTALPPRGAAQETYQDLVLEAIQAHKQGDHHAAHALFERAHLQVPNARALRGMGVASFEAGRFARALEELTAALNHPAKPLDPPLRALTEALRARARAQVGVVHLQLLPADAVVVTADGENVSSGEDLLLDAGQHRLRVTAAGHEEVIVDVDVAAGSERALSVVMTPKTEAPPSPPAKQVPQVMPNSTALHAPNTRAPPRDERHRRRVRTATTLIALAAVAGVAVGGLSLTGTSRVEKIAQACALGESSRCDPAERDHQLERANIQTLERTSVGLLGAAGALAVGAAGVLIRHLLVGRRATARPKATELAFGSRF
jgi:hypothetical protein